MIIPRYSHNYAQFCQLLNSNLFTHRRILMLSREATSEIYGPRVYSLSYLLCDLFLFAFNFRSIIPKTQKYLAALFITYFISRFIESYLSYLPQLYLSFTQEGLRTPVLRRVASICSLCVGIVYIGLLGPYWIDILVL